MGFTYDPSWTQKKLLALFKILTKMANQTIHICDENSTFEKIFVSHCKCTGYCERFMTNRAVTHTQITLPYP